MEMEYVASPSADSLFALFVMGCPSVIDVTPRLFSILRVSGRRLTRKS